MDTMKRIKVEVFSNTEESVRRGLSRKNYEYDEIGCVEIIKCEVIGNFNGNPTYECDVVFTLKNKNPNKLSHNKSSENLIPKSKSFWQKLFG